MRRAGRLARIVLAGLLGLSLTGCWDQAPIENRAVVVAIAVDPGRRGNERWTFLFPNVSATASSLSSTSPSENFYAVAVDAPSLAAAFTAVQQRLARDVYPGQLQVVLWSDRLPTRAVASVVAAVAQNGIMPSAAWVLATVGQASRILTEPSPQSVVPSYYLAKFFGCRSCQPFDLGEESWDWWDRHLTPGIAPIAPVAQAAGQTVTINRLAVYPPDGPPAVMPPLATEGYGYLSGRVNKATLSWRWRGQWLTLADIRDTPRIRVHLERGAVVVQETVNATGILAAVSQRQPMEAAERAAARLAAAAILDRCRAAVRFANRTHTDPFGYARLAAWTDNRAAAGMTPTTLDRLPIRADLTVHVTVRGAGEFR
ncbi:MAG: hypothetical protein K6V97_05220 [Actinomycetia bacterium]|nr:hypothetical protein [Actinomycetes bacterium]